MSDGKALFPKKFCDYWLEKPKTWKSKNSVKCYYCESQIKKDEEYFEIDIKDGEVKRGHTYHLGYAETIEWVPKVSTE